jgi:serine/threonine protein kinase
MPSTCVANYLTREIGVNPNHSNRTQQSHTLVQAAQRLGNDLSSVLYNAVVKLDGNTALVGPALSTQQLNSLKVAARQAKKHPSCTAESRQAIKDFEGAANRYVDLLETPSIDSAYATSIINKQISLANKWGTNATPRHSLIKHNDEIYEVLTWMTQEEVTRLENRFSNTNGLFSIAAERSRTRNWGDKELTEYKVTLGSGSFGAARLARRVSDDQYMVLKKVHPQDVGPRPAITPVIRGVNDGSSSGVSKVYDSFLTHSTRNGVTHNELSAYTLSEIGIIDTHKFMNIFSVMCYALNPEYQNQELAQALRTTMLNGSDTLHTLVNAARLDSNPCKNAETVRQFRNTFAYQMLDAVNQMHQKGRAHNDIKPDNFVLAYDDNNLLRVKLIDFDMNASVKETIGVPRDVYAAAFSAPQVSSRGANNQADRNDAYSMGCTLRLLNGEPVEALIIQRMIVKGEIRDTKNNKIKPVEDRRAIESRFLHIPELSTLHDIIGLLSHPHSGKRYTITQAMQSPLFTQTNNMLSAREFSDMAEKIIRQGYLIPKSAINDLDALQQCEKALAQQQGKVTVNNYAPMASALSEQDNKLLVTRYVQAHGEQQLNQKIQKVHGQVVHDNRNALLRRGMRQLNIAHHLKGAAAREASYVYKSPKK